MVLTKSFDPIYPVKWIMSFVKTSSLRSVEIRKICRECFTIEKLTRVLCTVPSCTYNAHIDRPKTKSSLEFLFWKGKFC